MKRMLLVVAAVGLCAGLFAIAQDREDAKSEDRDRVFEMRTYTAAEGKLPALHARFRDHTNKLFRKHGMQIIGYWVPAEEPKSQNTLVYMLAFPSKDACRKSWDAFRKDPDWLKAKADSEVNGKLVDKAESVFLNPTDYSPIK